MATSMTRTRPAADGPPEPETAGGTPRFELPRTRYPQIWAALAAPFEPREIFEREVGGGEVFRYVKARSVMNRLDNVVGPEGWSDHYESIGDGGSLLCRLSIFLPDNACVVKTGVGGRSATKDASDEDKTAESDALKRAAVKFGVARYLYGNGVPAFVSEFFPLDGPAVPDPLNPAEEPDPGPAPRRPEPAAERAGERGSPRTGKALFAWAKDQEQRYQVGLLKYLNQWARLQDFPGRMIDWDADQVAYAYQEASRKIADYAGREEAVSNR